MKGSIFILLFLFVLPSWAHEKHKNKSPGTNKKTLQKINSSYLKNVKLIFKQKCFDCHTNQTHYPWYYPIPGIKYLIDDDIQEAQKHLDMNDDFPFGGHGSPKEDLEGIKKVVEDGEMPPLRYRLLHWGSALTEEEKTVVFKWVEDSGLLKAPGL